MKYIKFIIINLIVCTLFSVGGCKKPTTSEGLVFLDGYVVNYTNQEPNVSIPATYLDDNGNEQKVIGIGKEAFLNNNKIKSIELSENITEIQESAFIECHYLSEIKLNENLKTIGDFAFKDCISLTKIVIPDTVESIGNSAFEGCVKLNTVTLSDRMLYVSSSLFKNCISLTSVVFSKSLYKIFDSAFENCISLKNIRIPNTVSSIGEKCFARCVNLRKVILSVNIKTLPKGCFEECYNLKTIKYSNNLKSIEENAFNYCYNLQELKLSDIKCHENALINCDKSETVSDFVYKGSSIIGYYGTETNIVIPQTYQLNGETITIKSIEKTAFNNNQIIKEVLIPNTIENISYFAFENCYNLEKATINCGIDYCQSLFKNCYKLKDVTLSDQIETLYANTFLNCISLESIKLPQNLKYLGRSTFENCYKLKNIVYNDKLENILSYAFAECYSLEKIELPNSVNVISHNAFLNCTGLKEIYLPKSEYSISEESFLGCTNVEIIDLAYCTEFSMKMISNMPSLKQLIIEENERYKFYDGVLYDVINKTLIYYPKYKTDKSYTVLDGIVSIGSYAFYNNDYIEYVNFPTKYGSVPNKKFSIGQYAFYGCDNLVEFYSPHSISNIYDYAFSACPKLQTVYVNRDYDVNVTVFENSPNAKIDRARVN